MKIVGTMFRQPILIALTFVGFVLLLANLPVAECSGKEKSTSVNSSIHNNKFSALAESDDENESIGKKTDKEGQIPTELMENEGTKEDEGPKEEMEGAASAVMKNEDEGWTKIESSKKLKMKEITSNVENQQKNPGNSGFQINIEDLTLVALYLYQNPPNAIKIQSDKDEAREKLKGYIVQKYIQRNVKAEELKFVLAEKEITKLLNEQIDIILSGSEEEMKKKCQENEAQLSEFVDQFLLRDLLRIVENKFGNTANYIQKHKKVFGLYLRHYKLSTPQKEGEHKFVYNLTTEQRYRLNGNIDTIFYEFYERKGDENEPESKNALHNKYQKSLKRILSKKATTAAESSAAGEKKSSLDKAFLREKIDNIIVNPTNRMKAAKYHKLYAMFLVAFGIYVKAKQTNEDEKMSKEQIQELDDTILEMLFEGIDIIDKEKLEKLFYEKYRKNAKFHNDVRNGEFEDPMKKIFGLYTKDPEMNGGKIDPKKMPILLRWQLDSLIYEILYRHVDDGFGLDFGNHIVKDIEKELYEAVPYDESQHYARRDWQWWHDTTAIPIPWWNPAAAPAVPSFYQYNPVNFPPLAHVAVQSAAAYAQSGHFGQQLLPYAAHDQAGHFVQQQLPYASHDQANHFVQQQLPYDAHDHSGNFVQHQFRSVQEFIYSDYDFEEQIQKNLIQSQIHQSEKQSEKFKNLDNRNFATVASVAGSSGTAVRISAPPKTEHPSGTAVKISHPSQPTPSASQATGPATSMHESTSNIQYKKKSWAEEVEEVEKNNEQTDKNPTNMKEGETYASILLKSTSGHHPHPAIGPQTHGATEGNIEVKAGNSNPTVPAEHHEKQQMHDILDEKSAQSPKGKSAIGSSSHKMKAHEQRY